METLLKAYKGLPKEIYIIFISRIINSMGNFVFPLMTLILTVKMGFSAVAAGTFLTVMFLTKGPCIIIGGKIIDSVGRRKTIIIFQSIGAFSYFICAFLKPNIFMAILIMITSSLYAIAAPAFDSIVGDITTDKNRKQSFSLVYMGCNIGYAAGPVMAGILFNRFFPLIFIVDSFTTVASIVIFIFYIKETLVVNKKEEIHETYKRNSIFSVIKENKIVMCFAVIMFTYQFAYAQWSFILPIQMKHMFSSNGAFIYTLLAALNGLVVILFTPIVTHKLSSKNSLFVISISGFVYASVFFSFGMFKSVYPYFGSMFIMTLGEIAIAINDSSFIAKNTLNSNRGRINSLVMITSDSGYAVGPIIMGGVLTRFGYTYSWTAVSILNIIGAVSMFLLFRKTSDWRCIRNAR
ncbi:MULTISPECIES: MFS transporter [Clostridium]|uniref:MFS transporter n=1 Tax=Clostridium TaxID=1485 RepID=UPI0008252D1A|nr:MULTISPECIES: MFS transporter [Clostridium]PJI09521.1 MFS transporter [Clostridium sp. CT7]